MQTAHFLSGGRTGAGDQDYQHQHRHRQMRCTLHNRQGAKSLCSGKHFPEPAHSATQEAELLVLMSLQ